MRSRTSTSDRSPALISPSVDISKTSFHHLQLTLEQPLCLIAHTYERSIADHARKHQMEIAHDHVEKVTLRIRRNFFRAIHASQCEACNWSGLTPRTAR